MKRLILLLLVLLGTLHASSEGLAKTTSSLPTSNNQELALTGCTGSGGGCGGV